MTSQNQTEKAPKTPGKAHDNSASNAAESSKVERELTDEETAAVVGGVAVGGQHGKPMN
jgi:hypothetical protein